jgi:hypothetical protein
MSTPTLEAANDTAPDAARVQLALLSRSSAARRFQLLRSLSRSVIEMSRRALREPVDRGQRALRFVALNYGPELAAGLKRRQESQTFGKERNPMAAPDLLAALVPVVDLFERLGVSYYLGGSVASSSHGVPRTTLDVDLVADIRDEQVGEVVSSLQDEYYVDDLAVRRALARRSSFNLIHLATMLKVDVFIPKQTPHQAEALRRAVAHRLEESEGTRLFRLASAEDTVLAKLDWYRRGGEVSERQWGDVVGVVRVQAQALDRDYLARWARQLGVADLLERALREADDIKV